MNQTLQCAVTIVDSAIREKMMDICTKQNLPILSVTHGHGLAENEILELLGLDENRKSILVAVLTQGQTAILFHQLNEKLDIKKHGKGISFTVPLSSASGFLDRLTRTAGTQDHSEEEEPLMTPPYPYELIITIVQKGFAETVKASATKAGARGGTMLHALGLGGAESAKFLGIHIQPEKELVLLVVEREHRKPVMQAILDSCGIATEGRGICFSLPVSDAVGLSPELDGMS